MQIPHWLKSEGYSIDIYSISKLAKTLSPVRKVFSKTQMMYPQVLRWMMTAISPGMDLVYVYLIFLSLSKRKTDFLLLEVNKIQNIFMNFKMELKGVLF